MARGKLSVRYIKEILRLKYEAGLGQRDISRSVRVSVGSVNPVSHPGCAGWHQLAAPRRYGPAGAHPGAVSESAGKAQQQICRTGLANRAA